ncbi:hypothetical protein QWY90_03080 [Flavobacterium paronense]|uniref:GIY-YIG domain-containing protein n=1 Tax=Flavobacterium paronense TaxID=1392775 RepID=A0ABV5GDJ3_9FLAO|nr:hypothetical protein [Flavobacterium paronense]MDN3676290.1 hypothetical protein [Flavobacterium paronense]
MNFSPSIIDDLKYYVYLYSHPITHEVFYVGKGKGNRVFAHLLDQTESQKVLFIKSLELQGLKPKIEILVHGLEDEELALRVESSVIDLIGIHNLTNKQNGYKSATFGRMSIDQVTALYHKQKGDIDDAVILIRINQAFRYSMPENELYEYTRGRWVLNPQRAKKAKYAFAVYQGVVQEVYEILDWYKAGSTNSIRLEDTQSEFNTIESLEGRFEFVGNIAPKKIRDKYRYISVEHYFKRGNSNPIMYINC